MSPLALACNNIYMHTYEYLPFFVSVNHTAQRTKDFVDSLVSVSAFFVSVNHTAQRTKDFVDSLVSPLPLLILVWFLLFRIIFQVFFL